MTKVYLLVFFASNLNEYHARVDGTKPILPQNCTETFLVEIDWDGISGFNDTLFAKARDEATKRGITVVGI